MAHIVLSDAGIAFDGTTPRTRPLGGAEGAFVALAEALAARGHRVEVRNACAAPVDVAGVAWRPLAEGFPAACDLHIANRSDKLLRALPGARRTAFWVHNPCRYLLKARYLWKLAVTRPVIVCLGAYHLSTLPAWVPDGGRVVIPHGLPDTFLHAAPREPPAPRAVFTSNPLRGLDWLLDRWERDIRPQVPEAGLDLYCGPGVYGSVGDRKADEMRRVLDRARALAGAGVVLHEPLPREALAAVLQEARVMLYPGDLNETFCFAVAEAQALGLPAVVLNQGALPERVRSGGTGFVAADDTAFVSDAVRLLRDDALWRKLHRAALAEQRSWTWNDAAAAFERLLPED